MAHIAEMYALCTLDCVIEAAHAVALDFVNRPRHYKKTPDNITEILGDLKARTGTDPKWPNTAQRAAIYGGFFGPSDAKPADAKNSQFHQLAAAVRQAAVAYSERVYDTGEPMLRRAFIDAAVAFRSYLETMKNGTLKRGWGQIHEIFEKALEVLRDDKIAGVFGTSPAPAGNWPLKDYNGDGAFLIEEITRTLSGSAGGQITQQKFLVLQRVAMRGAETIFEIESKELEKLSDDEVKKLISSAYAWSTSLKGLSK